MVTVSANPNISEAGSASVSVTSRLLPQVDIGPFALGSYFALQSNLSGAPTGDAQAYVATRGTGRELRRGGSNLQSLWCAHG